MPEAESWNANWISLSSDPREDLGVFAFRRCLVLQEVPTSLLVRVAADQRYKLFMNGEFVGFGPQRGDELHWFYEAYELAPFLKQGENWIAVIVWNFGRWAPMAQHTVRTAFVLEADASSLSEKGKDPITPEAPLPEPDAAKRQCLLDVSTPEGWEVRRLETWGFDMLHSHEMNFYIDIGPGEIMDFRGAPWGWRTGSEPLPPGAKREEEGVGDGGLRSERADPKAKREEEGVGDGGFGESTSPPVGEVGERSEPGEGAWRKPHVIHHAQDRGANGGGTPWMLIPRSIPAMRYERRGALPTVRHGFTGDFQSSAANSMADVPLAIKPGTPLLLDYGELLCAYPRFTLQGPPGATLTVTYAEALWNSDGTKGNRNEVAGKTMKGYQDKLIMDGEKRTIEPLWWRTYRYLLIEVSPPTASAPAIEEGEVGGGRTEQVETARNLSPQPLSPPRQVKGASVFLHSLDAIETGFPLKVESSFEADDPWVKPIWDVSVRTAERCAGETYFDCPYYEQLQYAGDTRIQALIGYYLGRDRALTRNAVETLGWSLMDNGLTQSRYPSRQCQVIPPFSLWWVMMVWDQMLYDDPSAMPNFVSFQALSRILGRFRKLQREPGQFWQFGDWVPSWRWGVPPGGANALMHRLTLEMATTAAERIKGFKEVGEAKQRGVKFWQDWANTSESPLAVGLRRGTDNTPSEHAEALYRCHLAMFDSEVQPWPTEALAKANAAKCTYYFSYYKHLAMFGRPVEGAGDRTDLSDRTDRTDRSDWSDRADRSDKSDRSDRSDGAYPFDYLQELQPWKEMIENGLSTFAENPEPTRSDCHAWSAHPILGFFQIVAGVTSIAPGWKKARVMPHPGSLKRFEARIAHPDGELRVFFENGKFVIDSPIPFEFRWLGKREELPSGKHKL